CLAVAGAAALQPIEVGEHSLERGAGLLDLLVERRALRVLPAEQREEAAALAAEAARLIGHPIELALLLAGGLLVALDLVGARRIDGAAIDLRELRFEPRADRVRVRCARRRRHLRERRRRAREGRERDDARSAFQSIHSRFRPRARRVVPPERGGCDGAKTSE